MIGGVRKLVWKTSLRWEAICACKTTRKGIFIWMARLDNGCMVQVITFRKAGTIDHFCVAFCLKLWYFCEVYIYLFFSIQVHKIDLIDKSNQSTSWFAIY
jgi:hypothetical protein